MQLESSSSESLARSLVGEMTKCAERFNNLLDSQPYGIFQVFLASPNSVPDCVVLLDRESYQQAYAVFRHLHTGFN